MNTVLLYFLSLAALCHNSLVPNHPSAEACSALVRKLGSSIVQSSGSEYNATAHGAWNLFNDGFAPACIVFPRNASHVQAAMRSIRKFGARYAVQAGGHSAMKGWNTVQDGVLIHFSHMKRVSYDASLDTITLEPGIRWNEAVSTLQAQGVAPVGGRQGDVGTGLLLGGGLSFLSPANGFAADSFKALDVVLVSGELVTATAHNQYADLFRALKGSANRFGIVTRYELFPVHTGTKDDKIFFGGSILYPNSSIEAVLNATARYVRDVNDPKAALLVSVAVSTTQNTPIDPIVLVNAFYNGTELPDNIFGELKAIPALSRTLGPLSYLDVSATLTGGEIHGFGQRYGGSSLLGDARLFLDAYRRWTNFTVALQHEMSVSFLVFTPVPRTQIEAGRARGGNALSPPDTNFAMVQIGEQLLAGVTRVSPEFDAGKLLLLEQIPRSKGLPLLMNECERTQNVFETYGDFENLKRVYAKYDPERFNMRHTDGPMGL